MLMRDAEGRKEEASKIKQTTRQSNTAHLTQSLFLRKMSCHGWDSNLYDIFPCYITNAQHFLMRDEEGRKKEASKIKQTTRQSDTAHDSREQETELVPYTDTTIQPDTYMYIHTYIHT